MANILVVDDERDIRELLEEALTNVKHNVTLSADGSNALELLKENYLHHFDLVLLDIMMPKLRGIGLMSKLKEFKIDIPVIFLTAKDSVEDKIDGFEVGADDYITKPFHIEELLARIKAVLKRNNKEIKSAHTSMQTDDIKELIIKHIKIDFETSDVTKNNQFIELTPFEFRVLKYLALNRGKVISKRHLFDEFWDRPIYNENIIESHISKIRQKIGDDIIETKRAFGYIIR
jgi:two-component system alkaline phosphatase synthesis response regulator PhoP